MKFFKAPLFIIALVGLFSCGDSYVLSPERMEDILVDLHLAEGIAIEHSIDFKSVDQKLDLYSTVYAKHNTDKDQFDSSMVYYSENLDELKDIYDIVYERLVALDVKVEVGDFSPTSSSLNQEVYSRIVTEDKDVIPYVENELWVKTRAYDYTYSDFDQIESIAIRVDTLINRKLELRYTIAADSLVSAQCKATMYYDEDDTEDKVFDLDLDSAGLVTNTWTLKDSPKKIVVKFDAEGMNENATLSIKDIRLYDMDAEAHSISLFK